MKPIVQQPHPALREQSVDVPIIEIPSKKIQGILRDMHATLATQHDGVALAAPQIGVNLRIFVVTSKIFEDPSNESLVYINPVMTKSSKTKKWLDEGCLSVRGIYGKVHRHTHTTITAYDERGRQFTRGASGLLAQIFQHETDHLDGILFCDNARDVHEYDHTKIA